MHYPRWAPPAAFGSALALLPATAALAAPGASPFITGYAGTGTAAAPIAGPATSSPLYLPDGVALDGADDLYIADARNAVIEQVTPGGTLSILNDPVAAPALAASPNTAPSGPQGVAVGASGTTYVADASADVVYAFSPSGTRSIVAGTGAFGAPTPGPAASSTLGHPDGVAVDAAGDVFIADTSNNLIEEVTPGPDPTLSVIAGDGSLGAPTEGPALDSALAHPRGVAVDAAGDVFVADTANNVIEKLTPGPDRALSIVAGNETGGLPTPGPARSSELDGPQGVAVDPSGNVYVADTGNSDIERVAPGGTLSIVAGTGVAGTPTYGEFASGQPLGEPTGVAVDPDGTLFVADAVNNVVDRIGLASPGAPTALAATVTGTSAALSFLPPADIGLFAVTGYEISLDGGQTWQTLVTSGTRPLTATITGLTPGTTYSVEVRADNGAGSGLASASVAVTPPAPAPATATPGATTTTSTTRTTTRTTTRARPTSHPPKPSPFTFTVQDGGNGGNGGMDANVVAPGPGTLDVLASEAHEGLAGYAQATRARTSGSAALRPGPGRFAYAVATVVLKKAGPVIVHLQLTAAGRALLVRHRQHGWALHVNVSITYTPNGGAARFVARKIEILPARPVPPPAPARPSPTTRPTPLTRDPGPR